MLYYIDRGGRYTSHSGVRLSTYCSKYHTISGNQQFYLWQ